MDGNGVRFANTGTIVSASSLPAPSGKERSLEIWITAAKTAESSTILAFYDPMWPRGFWLGQSVSDLELQVASSSAWRDGEPERVYVPGAFRTGRNGFWAITSGPSGVSVYRDAVLAIQTPAFRIAGADAAGRLILGTAPLSSQPWSGDLRALAIYDRELPQERIAVHYKNLMEGARPEIASDDRCIALYRFDEHTGHTVHNAIGSEYDLQIPSRYTVVGQTVLDPIWRAARESGSFWEDGFINIAGFIPAGFCFCCYFAIRGSRQPGILAVVIGSIISVFIELVQSHLPTRDSSMSDLVSNILGSILGVLLYRCKRLRIRVDYAVRSLARRS